MFKYWVRMKTMSKKFYPSINGIYFKNFDMVEDTNSIKHIRGDLYIDGKCIGYYNPVYQPSENAPTQYFLRLEDEFKFIYEKEGRYESVFNKTAIPLAEYDCPVGLQELIADLEIVTSLYEFMSGIRPHCDFDSLGMIGIINGTDEKPIIKVIQIRDESVRTDEQILQFINDKVDSIYLDSCYPVRLFKTQSDFTINT